MLTNGDDIKSCHSNFNETPYRTLPTLECFVLCALARDVRLGHFAQDPPGSVGPGPQLLLPLSAPLAGTYPALPFSQLLPYIPPGAGPVPRPGRGRGSPTETDQRKVRVDSSIGGSSCTFWLPPWKEVLAARQLTQNSRCIVDWGGGAGEIKGKVVEADAVRSDY